MKQQLTIEQYGKVGVLLGGTSAERDISLLSGETIYRALKKRNFDVVKIDTQSSLYEQIKLNEIDTAFIALHGRDGEDGVVQGFLKLLGIPFTGSDTASSALAMNKLHCKRIWRQLNFATAAFEQVIKSDEFDIERAKKVIESLGTTLFVKPIREGSSVGMSKVSSASELVNAVKLAQKYDDVLVEKFIAGREYTVTILNGKALPSISMVTPNDFYDYDAKYKAKTTEYFCPSGLSQELENQVRTAALNAFNAIGCSGWGRVDFIQDEKSSEFMLLEANTVPGMTETSLVPKSANAAGISFEDLVVEILSTSKIPSPLFDGRIHG